MEKVVRMNFMCVTIAIILTLSVFKACVKSELTDVIATDKGPIRGEILTTVRESMEFSAFRGIPYGKPPIGYLRFRPPEEADPWTEILNATSEATPCPQRDLINGVYVGNEDCLNLNVYTPWTNFTFTRKPMRKLLPVMVWIHGGAFTYGWTNMSFFGPDFLIENNVVVVAMNYRLGALGFLSLNHENATGNAGLKDQLLALQWVRRNIWRFGGNPKRVTIFGHSAGAASVDYHILSNSSKGLFQQSISMSGSHLCSWAFSNRAEAQYQAFKLGRQLGVFNADNDKKLLEYLYLMPAEKLVEATERMHFIDVPFKPSLENTTVAGDSAFITQCSINKYKSGNFSKLAHLTGFMKDEAILFAPGDRLMGIKEKLNSEVVAQNKNKQETGFVAGWNNLFSSFVVSSTKILLSGVSDAAFNIGIDVKQKLMKKYSPAPVYYYRISYAPNVSIHKQIHHIEMDGAAHEDDLAYIWHISILDYPKDPEGSFAKMQYRMSKMWTNFAKTRHPIPFGSHRDPLLNISWPISGIYGKFLDIDEKLTIDKDAVGFSGVVSQFLPMFSNSECPAV